MSMNLNIPITQTITLPDSWQACKTPQELSYWIIAKFDNFTTQYTEIHNAMLALQSMVETNTNNIATNDAEIAEIKNTLTSINSDIETLQTDYNTLNTDLTTLYGLHQQLSNKVAGMEDAVLDLPGIKQDITELQTNVSTNTENITTLQTDVSTNTENIITLTNNLGKLTNSFNDFRGAVFYKNSTVVLADIQLINRTVTMLNSSMDYRQFISVFDTTPSGTSFTVYYNSDYNVPFGHYDTSINGIDITTSMESSSIDGNITLTDLLTKTKVAIKFFKTNLNKKYSWAVL